MSKNSTNLRSTIDADNGDEQMLDANEEEDNNDEEAKGADAIAAAVQDTNPVGSQATPSEKTADLATSGGTSNSSGGGGGSTGAILEQRTQDEVYAWFKEKYNQHADKFKDVSGSDLAGLTENQLKDALGVIQGQIVYNAIQKLKGWRRDLTRECVEPNPGPTWSEFIDEIKRKYGEDYQYVQDLFNDLKGKVKAANPDVLVVRTEHLEAYLESNKSSDLHGQRESIEQALNAIKGKNKKGKGKDSDEAKDDKGKGKDTDQVATMVFSIKDNIIKREIPPLMRHGINDINDVLVFHRRDDPTSNFYVGTKTVADKVQKWVHTLHITGQAKQVFVVDGSVKSGKTIAARFIVPYFASTYPRFSNACAVYIDLAVLATVQNPKDKETKFCEIFCVAFERVGMTLPMCENITKLTGSLAKLKQVVIVTLDEYHFLYNNLTSIERTEMALRIRNLLLDEGTVYYVLTASTQPLLWTSVNFSLSNGISLLGAPTIFTTPTQSSKEQIRSAICLFHVVKEVAAFSADEKLQISCAVQVQVLQVMAIGHTEQEAIRYVYNSKALTYQRDLTLFYGHDEGSLTYLTSLANGTAVPPETVMEFGILQVAFWTEKRNGLYYLKDQDLAALLAVSTAKKPVVPAEAILLWPLIPIAQCAERDGRHIPNDYLDTLPHSGWNELWSFVLQHPVNQEAASKNPHKTWNLLFRMARNIYCHEGDFHAENVGKLADHFIAYFTSRRDVDIELRKIMQFYED